MSDLPTGTVTFLFTDIEGSTRLWEEHPDAMRTALALHDALLQNVIEAHSGYVFKSVGDAFCATFATAPDALYAVLAAQRGLSAQAWGETGPLKVRMALHTGAAEERGGDYFGPPLNRVARLLSAGHGGQVLLSLATQELVRDHLPGGTSLRDMGEHRLKDLARPEHIFQLVAPDLPSDFALLKTLDASPNNLPAQLTPIVGREREVKEVRELLRKAVRLITLTGPGGTGKTRLSLQVAADLIDDFEKGVYFVALASISDSSLVASTIAQTLDIRETTGRPLLESLKDYLRDKEILLILDNFEQVISAAPLVADLLATCPKLKILATSREALHLRGEREFPVLPLALPDLKHLPPVGVALVSALTQYAAVELFIQRALSVKPDFAVTNENAPAVAEICAHLDGLPLAIELAAARIKLLPPQAMLTRLSGSPSLRLLTGGARDLPARQQTLRGAIAWSHDLLDDEEKALFRRLSVFVGGCTLPAAEAVCNAGGGQTGPPLRIDALDGVSSLVDKSLLKQEEAEGESRFVMLGTIREYALERLSESGEERDIRRHHLNFFLVLSEEVELRLHGPDQGMWLRRLEADHDNFRAAMECSLRSGEIEAGLRLAGALWWFWYALGYFSEGREWLEKALSAGGGSSAPVRAKALNGAGLLAWHQGQYGRAEALGEESISLFRQIDDKRGAAFSLIILGLSTAAQGHHGRAIALWEESLSLFRESGHKWGTATALFILGEVAARYQKDYGRVIALCEESLSLFRELGDKWGIANSLRVLGLVVGHQGDYGRAAALCEESLSIFRELGDKGWGIVNSLRILGRMARYQGDYDRAIALYKESLTMLQEMGDRGGIAECLDDLAGVAGAEGHPKRSARLFGAAAALREAIDAHPPSGAEYDKSVADALAGADEKEFAAAWAEGGTMTLERVISYALELR